MKRERRSIGKTAYTTAGANKMRINQSIERLRYRRVLWQLPQRSRECVLNKKGIYFTVACSLEVFFTICYRLRRRFVAFFLLLPYTSNNKIYARFFTTRITYSPLFFSQRQGTFLFPVLFIILLLPLDERL